MGGLETDNAHLVGGRRSTLANARALVVRSPGELGAIVRATRAPVPDRHGRALH